MSKIKLNNTGSTLIEVLVAILVVGLVVTGAMLSIAYSVKNSAEARYRETASQLAQDGMEVVKLRREVEDWSAFNDRSGTYCLSSVSSGALPFAADGPSCADINQQNKNFDRTVIITSTATQVTATVVVSWQSDSNQAQDVRISQVFSERAI